jgi:hypothetical protein
VSKGIRRFAALAAAAVFAGVLSSAPAASAATTYEIQVGQEFFEVGAPAFSTRFYPGSVKVTDGDLLHFDFGFLGMAPEGDYPQELMGEEDVVIGGEGNPFDYDPDEGTDRLKFDLSFFGPGPDQCGTVDNPCVWGPNTEPIFPALPEDGPFDLYVRVEGAPGTTLWGASFGSPDVNVNFKVEIVDGVTEAASTQAELDARAEALKAKDYDNILALHNRMSSKQTWHINKAGQKVWDVFVGAAAGPVEILASYPRRTAIRDGQRVQFHFMGAMEPHTATFGGAKAKAVFDNFISPACDPDGDAGALPDVDPIGFDETTGLPICPEGSELEADVHPLFPWERGDGRVTKVLDYENSGLQFPHFPDEGSFDVNPDPWQVRFPNESPDKGFKFICLIHGGFMGGRILVK